MTGGESMRELRERLGLTQRKMATLLGTAQSRVSQWETGRRRVPTQVAAHLRTLGTVHYIATMPERDQDDAHRLRYLAGRTLRPEVEMPSLGAMHMAEVEELTRRIRELEAERAKLRGALEVIAFDRPMGAWAWMDDQGISPSVLHTPRTLYADVARHALNPEASDG